jgi:DNA mismatch repair protein MutL
LFIDLNPAQVDVNVHPTKQEIKFEDEKIVYAFVQAAIKHALAQFSITPTLDFDLDPSIQQLPAIQQPFTEEKQAAATSTTIFKGFTQKHQAHFIEPSKKADLKNWKEFYEGSPKLEAGGQRDENIQQSIINIQSSAERKFSIHEDSVLIQLHSQFILVEINSGFILIHQQAAHERIVYERLKEAALGKPVATQRSMFPVTFELVPADAAILEELMNDLQQLGYIIEPFGKNTFVVQGTPADLEQGNEKHVIDGLLEQYKHFSNELKFSKREKLIRSLARQQAIKTGIRLTEREMRQLVNDLFACQQPNTSPDGSPVYLEFKQEQLEKMFKLL